MGSRPTLTAAALAAGLLLAGCAATLYEGKHDWREGWRSAEVLEVVAATEMERPRFYDCVRQASPQQLATTKFAIVKYRSLSRSQRRAVPVAAGQTLRPGDLVYVQLGRCDVPPVPQSGRS